MIPVLFLVFLPKTSSSACTSDIQYQLHVGLYVDDFVFHLLDLAQKELFKALLQAQIQVDFIGDVE